MANEKSSWGLGNFIAVIILAAILILGGSLLGSYVSNKQAQKSVAGTQIQFQPVVEKTISYDGQEGKNALELLNASHEVKTEESTVGIFVTSIDNTVNESDKYWMFYVDGQLAPVGADQYTTKNDEKIEWRYERFQ